MRPDFPPLVPGSGAQAYVIEGRPVSGKNHQAIRHRGPGRAPFVTIGRVARDWQADAVGQLARQRLDARHSVLTGPLALLYVAYQPADRCDLDNMEAALFDALKKARVIEDDGLIVDHRGAKRVDRTRPRFELVVWPLAASP